MKRVKFLRLPVLLLISALGLLTGCAVKHTARVEEALNHTETAKAIAARNEEAANLNVDLGMAYLEEGQHNLAKRKFEHALSLAPKSPEVLTAMGYYLTQEKAFKAAAVYFQQAYQIDPKNPTVLMQYGSFRCAQGNLKAAENFFNRAVQLSSFEVSALANERAGQCARKLGDHEKAERYFKRAVSNDPRLSDSYLNLAEMALEQEDYQAAAEYLTKYERRAVPSAASLRVAIALAEHSHLTEKVSALKARLAREEQS